MASEKNNGGKRKSSLVTENTDSVSKKARVSGSSELKYRCRFCPERLSTLTTVRDHIRNEHHEENEQRRVERSVRLSHPLPAKKTRQNNLSLSGQGSQSPVADSLINSRINKSLNVPKPGSQSTKDINDDKTTIYRCAACTFASVSYDLMIKHCQHHIIDEATGDGIQKIIEPIPATAMEVDGENIDVDIHTYKELNDKSSMNSFVFVDCDHELLKSDKWPGNFEAFNKSEIDRINCSSIYYFTRIIHFTSKEKTLFAPFMLYKCMKCKKYVDPNSVPAHVQQNSCSEQHKGFSCYNCGLPFLTENSMYLHYKTHKATIPDKKYITISFNYEADKLINAVLLKAAGRKMCESGNNKTVPQTPGTLQTQGGVTSTVQQGVGITQSQNGVNNTVVQQGAGTAQLQVGVNSTAQQSPGLVQPQGGVNSTLQQGPVNEQLAGINKPAQQAPAIQSQVGVKNNQMTKDARTMIIQGKNKTNESSEIADSIAKDTVATVYKCQCDLCFHMLDSLFKHIKSCTADLAIKKITCFCSLVFDEKQYGFHGNLHSMGVAKFNVKKVIVYDEKIITSNQHEFKETSGTKEDMTKRVTKKDIADRKPKSSKKLKKGAENTIDEIRKSAILKLTATILNLPNMVTRVGVKSVKNQQQTTVSNTRTIDPKSDDVTDKSVYKSGGSVSTAVTHTVHEANEEINTKYKAGESNIIEQTDNNVIVSDKAVDSDQELAMEENNIINSEGNTEENLTMVDTTIEVEMAEKNNTYMTNHEAHTKTHRMNNQETEAINVQNKKVNVFEKIIEEATSEDVLKVAECNISQSILVNKPEVKQVAESKTYTEDELLNEDGLSGEETSVYFDANLLTDDED